MTDNPDHSLTFRGAGRILYRELFEPLITPTSGGDLLWAAIWLGLLTVIRINLDPDAWRPLIIGICLSISFFAATLVSYLISWPQIRLIAGA